MSPFPLQPSRLFSGLRRSSLNPVDQPSPPSSSSSTSPSSVNPPSPPNPDANSPVVETRRSKSLPYSQSRVVSFSAAADQASSTSTSSALASSASSPSSPSAPSAPSATSPSAASTSTSSSSTSEQPQQADNFDPQQGDSDSSAMVRHHPSSSSSTAVTERETTPSRSSPPPTSASSLPVNTSSSNSSTTLTSTTTTSSSTSTTSSQPTKGSSKHQQHHPAPISTAPELGATAMTPSNNHKSPTSPTSALSSPTSGNSSATKLFGSEHSGGGLADSLTSHSVALQKARGSDDEHDNEIIQYVTKEKLERFYKFFGEMPDTEDLLLVKSCALEKDVLIAGDLFVTRNLVCFGAKFFGKKVQVIIPIRSIVKIEKKKFGFIQNSLKIESSSGTKMLLTSLNKRDAVYDFLKIVWSTTMDPAFAQTQVGGFSDHLHSLGESLDDDSDGDSPAPRTSLSKRASAEMKLNPIDTPQKKDAEHEHDGMDPHADNDGIQGASAPSSAVEAEKTDPLSTKSERIFRSRSQIHHQDSSGSSSKSIAMPPASTASPNVEATPSSRASFSTSISHDKHKVITLAKQKSKKLEKEDKHEKDKGPFVVTEEPLISQRLLMNEIFNEEAQTVYSLLFHGPEIKCSRRNDVQHGEWEKRDGVRVREGSFTDTIKLPSKDNGKDSSKDRYVLAKFKEVQQILSEDKGHFLVNTDITCPDPEVHEGVAVAISTTISSENAGRCRMTMSCQLKFPKSQVPKEMIERIFEFLDVFCRDLTTQINQRHPATDAAAAAAAAAGAPAPATTSSKLALLQDKYVVAFGIVALVLLVLTLFLWWYLSPAAPVLTEEELRWLSFIRKTRTEPIAAEDSITVLFDQYKTKVIGGAQHNVEESISALYEKLGKLRSQYVV